MFKKLKKILSRFFQSRSVILSILLVVMAFVLVRRLFDLQIINGESYQDNYNLQITRETTIPSTRGCIYDSDGNLLAYNKLAYDVTFQDVGSYETTREKNLTINGYLYQIMQILYANGDDVYTDFAIRINDAGEYEYTKSGTNLLRFRADVYGQSDPADMTPAQKAVSAEDMVKELGGDGDYGFWVISDSLEKPYTAEELAQYGLPETLSQEDTLKIIAMRSAINQNNYQKYISTTIAKDISDKSMSSLMESKGYYVGVDVEESSIRVYNESLYYANIIGYTGKISAEEIQSLNTDSGENKYDTTDIVGKAGLEQYYEKELQGVDGKKTVYVNNLGKVLKEDSQVDPQTGDDIYLTLKTDWQKAGYQLLEQYVAGIVWSNTYDYKEFDNSQVGTNEIVIPVYDIYYALFENNVLSVSHLRSSEATELEKKVYNMFLDKKAQLFADLKAELISDSAKPYNELSKEMQAYITYLLDTTMTELGILREDAIDTTDSTYLAWTNDESISLRDYLTYAISKDWMDITQISTDTQFLDSDEIFSSLCDYLSEYVTDDNNFSKIVYRYMIENDQLSPQIECQLLYDQGILEPDDATYQGLGDGSVYSFDFIKDKIYNLEIKPASLGLSPCSGSMVITDPNNGNVLACISYPGYDNNRLANDMDEEYFSELVTDKSSPFYNKATQELTAPGSTYKIVTSVAGVMEGVISEGETINCTGKFEDVDPAIKCWIYPGMHGSVSLATAIQESCNYFFNAVGVRLGNLGGTNGESDDATGIAKLAKYASMFGFDQETGIEMDESTPRISDQAEAPSAMGQGTNAYATVQLARYAGTIANGGTCYDLTLVDKITDSTGRTIMEKEPVVHSNVEATDSLWNTIHTGMNQMIKQNTYWQDIEIDMAGKTGTAEETGVPSHALFIGYAPYDNPEIAIACRITNGYTSANASLLAKDMIRYIYDLADKDTLITGHASVYSGGTISGARTD
ncbi:MAG: penicillin-binding transpeptidase domain-containing protein [Lachnospiraceae bacterium]|nr:penicillin-binding transpeptidase domain-containing protein [Lachnospiraceae bacterium]